MCLGSVADGLSCLKDCFVKLFSCVKCGCFDESSVLYLVRDFYTTFRCLYSDFVRFYIGSDVREQIEYLLYIFSLCIEFYLRSGVFTTRVYYVLRLLSLEYLLLWIVCCELKRCEEFRDFVLSLLKELEVYGRSLVSGELLSYLPLHLFIGNVST